MQQKAHRPDEAYNSVDFIYKINSTIIFYFLEHIQTIQTILQLSSENLKEDVHCWGDSIISDLIHITRDETKLFVEWQFVDSKILRLTALHMLAVSLIRSVLSRNRRN